MWALQARVWLVRQFRIEVMGRMAAPGKILTSPAAVGRVIVKLKDPALAPTGIPQRPPMTKLRLNPARRAGPPHGPVGPRVSTTRHGATVKNLIAGGGVGVRVAVGVVVAVFVGVAVAARRASVWRSAGRWLSVS